MNIRHLLLPCLTLLVGFGQSVWSAEPAAVPADKPGYTVTLELLINEKGIPENIRVADSQDPTVGEIMDKMAIAMLLKTNPKMEPRIKDGHPVKYTARVPFHFPPIEGDEGAEANKGPKPSLKMGGQKPVYPPALIRQDIAGGVILELVVNSDGKIARLTTLRASHPEFEQAATQAVSGWIFAPALRDGKPIESRFRIAVVFETKSKMADLKWRIPPRPSLGTFIVGYDDTAPVTTPAPAIPAPATPAPAK